MDFLCRNCSARNTSCMHTVVCCSLNEPASSSNVCSSPPVAISKTRAVSTFVSCTECNLTICGESAHSSSIAISCRISLSVHCARRLRLKNLAAKLTPVCLCIARRTVANLPLWKKKWEEEEKKWSKIRRRRSSKNINTETKGRHAHWTTKPKPNQAKPKKCNVRGWRKNMLLINCFHFFSLLFRFIFVVISSIQRDGIERLCLRHRERNKKKHVNTFIHTSVSRYGIIPFWKERTCTRASERETCIKQ